MKALNIKLRRDLWHLRGQMISVLLVVACGITCFVTMRSAHDALVRTRDAYYREYRFSDVFSQLRRAPEGVVARIGEIPGVACVETRVVAEVTLDVPGLDVPATARIVSVPDGRGPQLNALYLRSGRGLEADRPDEVLISEAFAQANGLEPGDKVGAVLDGRWQTLRIVGVAMSPEYVYEIQGGGVLPDNRRFGILWMGRKALSAAFDMDGAFNDVTLTLAPESSEPEILDRLDGILERYGGFGAYGRDQQLSNQFVDNEIQETRITSTVLPGIFLGVAAFLVNIVMSRLISTQREQIALLKAFGYTNGTIGRHYLVLALVPVLVGTVVGAIAGEWLGRALAGVYARFFHFPVLVMGASLQLMLQGLAISAGAACVGSMAAVRRAVSLPPAEAMRPEPPARFRPLLLERLGFARWLAIPSRMILRNIERRPGKAVLSSLGIALAVSLLVTGRFAVDAIDRLIELEFQMSRREDVEVLLANPAGGRARTAFTSLPGVLRVEPFRIVPARLRLGHRTRRAAIVGVRARDELRRLIDSDSRRVELPDEGLVLSAALAERLGAGAGATLTVEVLEGARPIRQVAVKAVVEDFAGLRATMELAALNRLLREGDSISGAYLAVDPALSERLYSQLKRTPAVGSIAVREVILESFRRTFAENMLISTFLLIGFSCVIAAAVVYNGARIALSERATELASLRILGFTRKEIAVLLLGEQTILLLLAVPFGFALGYCICALVVSSGHGELFRLPLTISARTFAYSFIAVAAAAMVSGRLVYGRLRRLDLLAVLKSRE